MIIKFVRIIFQVIQFITMMNVLNVFKFKSSYYSNGINPLLLAVVLSDNEISVNLTISTRQNRL